MMGERAFRFALWLHPRRWRDRYGAEICDLSEELMETEGTSPAWLVLELFASATRERVRVAIGRPRQVALGLALAVFLLGGGVIVLHHFDGPPHTAGTGPTVGGPITFTDGKVMAPDYIAVEGRGKVAGYEPRSYLLLGEVAPVYARDLHTLVGHDYPGVGFVPLGVYWASLPCTEHQEMTETSASGKSVSTAVACPSTTETVPTLVGSVTPTAMGTLSSMSLSPIIKYVHSATVAVGHVARVSPESGTRLPARSIVTVVSSLGPG
jgi:hypothetical protein